ncbi:MAG: succinate dehydrogenase, hydrophobic membrane anchor protein [Pseudomonadota bacterium]|nr:succinate dehydrogenase, hydrophobic membrane anchor protein [Pseudomonadota bacterium]
MDSRTPISRVNHLGSAKEGAHHWWLQRLSGLALVPLLLWFVVALVSVAGADYPIVVEWISRPHVTVFMVILIALVFYHAQLGVQVIIEDYVDIEWIKIASLIAAKFALTLLGVAGILAVLRVAFGG